MAQSLAQYDTDKTPLVIVDKDQFITHVNEEHQDELAMFINAFTSALVRRDDITSIKELYHDGILLQVNTIGAYQSNSRILQDKNLVNDDSFEENPAVCNEYFINFKAPISESVTLQQQYIALLQTAASKLGKETIKLRKQRFTIIDSYYASPNMYRLVVTAPHDTPLNHPGYAYLFELNSDELSTTRPVLKDSDKSLQRYYTLRKVWQDPRSSSIQAWIDVYIHDDTPGGRWARSLNCGMQIKTVREYPEKTEHLNNGQCLLICDETSLPTVANLLENWQNPLPPLVIALLNDSEDISYLHNLKLSKSLRLDTHFLQDNLLTIVNTTTTDPTEQIVTLINTRLASLPIKIGKVWGALEATNIKSLRQQLKTTLALSRQEMVIKVYWRAQ